MQKMMHSIDPISLECDIIFGKYRNADSISGDFMDAFLIYRVIKDDELNRYYNQSKSGLNKNGVPEISSMILTKGLPLLEAIKTEYKMDAYAKERHLPSYLSNSIGVDHHAISEGLKLSEEGEPIENEEKSKEVLDHTVILNDFLKKNPHLEGECNQNH